MKNKVIKRFFDITIALILLIIMLPLIAIIYMIVCKPAIFKQARPGLYGRPFNIYKFRTMRNLKDRNGNLLPDDKRLEMFPQNLICYLKEEIKH